MADAPRFRVTRLGNEEVTYAAVVDLPSAAYDKLNPVQRNEHILVRVQIGGMISERLATTWVTQICDQLNQFDIANATVAKLS